jgi:Flp pilus assembly protein TadG
VNTKQIPRGGQQTLGLGTAVAPFVKMSVQDFIVLKTAMRPLSTTTPEPRSPEFRYLGRTPRISGTRGGQSVLEFALLLPVMLLLLVGIIEVGRFAYYSILVANAARAGAQYGAQGLATAADTPGIQAAAENDGQNLPQLAVTASQQCGCNGAGLSGTCPASGCLLPNHPLVYVQVQATGTFNSLFNYPGLPPSFTVTSTEKMRVAQ